MSETVHTPKRRRSRAIRQFLLEAAIERAKVVYDAEGRNTAPNDAILAHLGYSSTQAVQGSAHSVLLKRFGLYPERRRREVAVV